MTREDREQRAAEDARRLLEAYRGFNGGHGLVLPPEIVKRLRAAGINGPYVEQEDPRNA